MCPPGALSTVATASDEPFERRHPGAKSPELPVMRIEENLAEKSARLRVSRGRRRIRPRLGSSPTRHAELRN